MMKNRTNFDGNFLTNKKKNFKPIKTIL